MSHHNQGRRPDQEAYSMGVAMGAIVGFLVCLGLWILDTITK